MCIYGGGERWQLALHPLFDRSERRVFQMPCYLAGEWHHVVLTERKDLDVLDDDELVVVLVEDGAVDQVSDILFVPLCEEHQCLGISLRRLSQALSFRVFTDAFEDGFDCAG